jgi:hypothetical protein
MPYKKQTVTALLTGPEYNAIARADGLHNHSTLADVGEIKVSFVPACSRFNVVGHVWDKLGISPEI